MAAQLTIGHLVGGVGSSAGEPRGLDRLRRTPPSRYRVGTCGASPLYEAAGPRNGLGLALLFVEHCQADLTAGRLEAVLEEWCQPFAGPISTTREAADAFPA